MATKSVEYLITDDLRSRIDEKLLAHTTEVFSIFDKDQDGLIAVEEVGEVLRSIGFNPTETEIQEIREEFEEQGDCVGFRSFLELVSRYKCEGDSFPEILEAFRVFDPNRTGVISALQLRMALMEMGEQLTEQEADSLISNAEVDRRGNIKYIDFAKRLLSE